MTVRVPQVLVLQGGGSSGLLSQGSVCCSVKKRVVLPHEVAVFSHLQTSCDVCVTASILYQHPDTMIFIIFILFAGMSLCNHLWGGVGGGVLGGCNTVLATTFFTLAVHKLTSILLLL